MCSVQRLVKTPQSKNTQFSVIFKAGLILLLLFLYFLKGNLVDFLQPASPKQVIILENDT